MRDLVPVEEAPYRSPAIVALGPDAPSLGSLFGFMTEAELRFESLRMRIVDRTFGARGEADEITEVWIQHPGRAKVVRRRESGPPGSLGRDFSIWVGDGETTTLFDAASGTARVRPVRGRVVGATDPDLPAFSRVYEARTALPSEALVEAFIHPHGFCRNVLATAAVRLVGTTRLTGDREAFIVRADHPRTSHVLTDRPDHWLEVGVDRMTGLILLLAEHVGDRVTRHAEVTDLELDPVLPEGTFRVFLSPDVKMLY